MSVRIDHPIPGDVHGDGSFYVWGDHRAPFNTVTRVVVTWGGGTTGDVAVTMESFGTCTWYCRVTGVPRNTPATLTAYGIRDGETDDEPADNVNFVCRDHFNREKGQKK